jgi:precorrin-3B synthase
MRLASDAERLGFVVRADDPRRRIIACPGKPACGSGLIAARVLAAEVAQVADVTATGATIHVSGCRKGCAHPGPATLTIVGTERGCGIVQGGSTRAGPSAYVDTQDLAAHVVRLLPLERVPTGLHRKAPVLGSEAADV